MVCSKGLIKNLGRVCMIRPITTFRSGHVVTLLDQKDRHLVMGQATSKRIECVQWTDQAEIRCEIWISVGPDRPKCGRWPHQTEQKLLLSRRRTRPKFFLDHWVGLHRTPVSANKVGLANTCLVSWVILRRLWSVLWIRLANLIPWWELKMISNNLRFNDRLEINWLDFSALLMTLFGCREERTVLRRSSGLISMMRKNTCIATNSFGSKIIC